MFFFWGGCFFYCTSLLFYDKRITVFGYTFTKSTTTLSEYGITQSFGGRHGGRLDGFRWMDWRNVGWQGPYICFCCCTVLNRQRTLISVAHTRTLKKKTTYRYIARHHPIIGNPTAAANPPTRLGVTGRGLAGWGFARVREMQPRPWPQPTLPATRRGFKTRDNP